MKSSKGIFLPAGVIALGLAGLQAPCLRADTGASIPDSQLFGFFNRPAHNLSKDFAKAVSTHDTGQLREAFGLMAAAEDPSALKAALKEKEGVDMELPDAQAASADAKSLSAVARVFHGGLLHAKGPLDLDVTETAKAAQDPNGGLVTFDGGLNKKAAGVTPVAARRSRGGSNDDAPAYSVEGVLGGGKLDNGQGFFKGGAMFGIPIYPVDSDSHGHLFAKAGLVYYGAGGKDQRIGNPYIQDASPFSGVVGAYTITAEDHERRSGMNLFKIAELGYQTPTLGRVAFNLAAGVGAGFNDTRTRYETDRTLRTLTAVGPCYDSHGNPTGQVCETYATQQLATQNTGIGPGSRSGGFMGTLSLGMDVVLSPELSLGLEAERFATWAAALQGNSLAATLKWYFR